MNQYLEKFIEDKSVGMMLDLGCGKGYDVACIKTHGWKANGVDKEDYDLNDGYREVDGTFKPILYDLVCASYVLPFITDKAKFVETMANNTKPGGYVFLVTFSKHDAVFVTKGETAGNLEILFSEKFENIKITEHEHYDNDEGHKHWHKLLVLTAQKKQEEK